MAKYEEWKYGINDKMMMNCDTHVVLWKNLKASAVDVKNLQLLF